MNEAITITGAIFTVLTALVFNRRDVTEFKVEMKESNASLRSDMREGFALVNMCFEHLDVRMDKMQGDLNTFAMVSALHDQRITTLEATAKN